MAVGSTAVATFALTRPSTHNHCQVPCGIYDDSGRIRQMHEDVTTISKAMVQINDLTDKQNQGTVQAQNWNQLTRWINTKETHANNIIKVTSEYFLTQKCAAVAKGTPGYDKYLENLATHHRVLKAAMVTKQTVDPDKAHDLGHAVADLGKVYGI